MVAGSDPVLAEKRCESEGRFPSGRSSSTRSIRCMGKKTIAGLNDSPSFTMSTRSSKDANSTPLRLSPSGDSERIMPQNLSRGLPSVTTTRHPGKKGSRGAFAEVGSRRWELSCINDCRRRRGNFATDKDDPPRNAEQHESAVALEGPKNALHVYGALCPVHCSTPKYALHGPTASRY